MAIKLFRGKYFFLSNMFPCKIEFQGDTFNSSENIYQSFKTGYPGEVTVLATCTPWESKQYWKGTRPKNPNFFKFRLKYMEIALRAKFEQSPELMKLLVDTGNEELIEGNSWNDTFWGVNEDGEGTGHNHLGKLLMKIRDEQNSNN